MNPVSHTVRIGDFSVTAVFDGIFVPPDGIITGMPQEAALAALRRNFRAAPPVITIAAYLVRHPGGLALIDSGSDDKFGPDHGRLIGNLAGLGVTPADIGTVMPTHAHIDHIGGLTGPDWQALYPNAELVIGATEHDFWLDEGIAIPERSQRSRVLAQNTMKAYAGRVRTVADGADGLAGISLVPLPGHTPGHSGWMLSSGAESLLIWGDVVHMAGLQFSNPEAGTVYDMEPVVTEASRRRAFDMAATERFMVAGPHTDFPSFGYVERRGGAFGFVPVAWMPDA